MFITRRGICFVLPATRNLVAVTAAVALAASGSAFAANTTIATGNVTWSAAGSWNNGVPTGSDVAVFSQSSANTTANLTALATVGGLRFTSSGSTMLQSSGGRQVLSIGSLGLTLDDGAGNVTIGNNGATNTRLGLSITTSQTWTNNSATALVYKEQGAMGTGTNVTNLANGATLSFNGLGRFKFAGGIGGGGGINVAGTGVVTLVGSGSYTGGTTITSGTLQIGEATTNGEITGSITNNGTLIYNRSGSITPVNSISGTGGVGITGIAGSIVTFSSSNSYTYTGGTRVLSPATLVIPVTSSLPGWNQAGKFQVDSGATLSVSSAISPADIGTMLGTGNFQAGSTIAINTGSGSITVSAAVPSGINLAKAGANTLTLTGANTPGSTSIAAGGALQVGDGTTAGSLSGNVTNSGTLVFNRSDDVTYGDVISGAGVFVKDGAGKLTLSASNAYSGNTFVNNGTLEVSQFNASSLYLSNNNEAATFRYVGSGNLSLSQQVQVGNIASGTGSGAIVSDGAGTLTFANPAFSNTFGGASAARSLILGGANAGNNQISGVIADNNAANGGVLSVVKNGAGKWVLAGINTYTGPTSIDAGTLAVNGVLGSGAVSVASAATLAGSGTINGPVAILAGGIVGPGNSPGTLTVNNSFALADTSVLNFELSPTDTTVGGGINDLITGVTNLTLDGVLQISGAGDWTTASNTASWRLFNYSGSLTNNGLTIGSAPTLGGGRSFLLDTATLGQVNLVIVPEPTPLAMLIGVAAAGFTARRISRRRSG